MSFSWGKYITLAEELKRHSGEEYARASVSRAYYGVFCICRDKIKSTNNKKSNTHREIIDIYQKSNKRNEQYIGKLLNGMRKERNDADYNGNKEITTNLAIRAISKAKKILEQF